jgi:uncharacterized iron-regulated membrane protein
VTGSVLVFWHEIDHAVLAWRFGQVSPLSITAIIQTVTTAYAGRGLTLGSLTFPDHANQPYMASFLDAADHYFEVLVNPYTGQIMGDRQWETSWLGFGTFGGLPTRILYVFVGLAPLVLFVTGAVMWWHRKKRMMR